ncbi:MAG: hypothetical protein HOO98_15885 [Nitrospira sp.]|nr:hypothetical protein [Nitrospira sp.]
MRSIRCRPSGGTGLGVSLGRFYAWLTRSCSLATNTSSRRGRKIRTSFLQSDRTYGVRRMWHDLTSLWMAEGWLYIAAVVDLLSTRVVRWSMQAMMMAQLVN